MSAWLLVGWITLYPSERFPVASFSSSEACELRVAWLADGFGPRKWRRQYACLEVPLAPAAPELLEELAP